MHCVQFQRGDFGYLNHAPGCIMINQLPVAAIRLQHGSQMSFYFYLMKKKIPKKKLCNLSSTGIFVSPNGIALIVSSCIIEVATETAFNFIR